MKRRIASLAVALAAAALPAAADDLTGQDRFLRTAVAATRCLESAEQLDNFKKAFSVCLEAKKSMVKY